MLELLFVISCAALDRIRGTSWGSSYACFVYAALVGAALGVGPLWLMSFIALFMIGESTGWGEPLGSALDGKPMNPDKLEWWQFGPLKQNAWLAVTFRGFLWGLPTLVLLPWWPNVWVFPVAMALAFPLSLFCASLTSTTKEKKWQMAEVFRGALVGVFILILL